MVFAGILAGGTGSRMESAKVPKQFIEICGVPIFIRTLKTFLANDKIDRAVVSVNRDWKDKYIQLIEEYNIDINRVEFVVGGDSRFTSLIEIVKKAEQLANGADSVIITHDCARIFVSDRIIEDNLKMIKQYDLVTTSLPVIDTILESEDSKKISSVPVRNRLYSDQGPQTFSVSKFLNYVSLIPEEEYSEYIEAVKVFLPHKSDIGIVKGERFNFKVTNDIDLEYAEFLIKKGYVK